MAPTWETISYLALPNPALLVILKVLLKVILIVAKAILGLIGFSTIGPVAGKPHSDVWPHVVWSPAPNIQAPKQLQSKLQVAMLLLEAFSQLCKALQWVGLGGVFSGYLVRLSRRLPRRYWPFLNFELTIVLFCTPSHRIVTLCEVTSLRGIT